MTTQAPVETLDLEDIQGFIMRNYPLPCVRYVYVHVDDMNVVKARETLGKLTDQHVTKSSVWLKDDAKKH
jgi:hypothetical protein